MVYAEPGSATARDHRRCRAQKIAAASRSPTRTSFELAKQALIIEEHYGCPMDIEWGKDGETGKIYILQARPETVQSRVGRTVQRFSLKGKSKVLATGRSIGQRIGSGPGPHHSRRKGNDTRAERRRARRGHDGPRLGAGHETRVCHRHESRRAHLSRGDHRARARHSRGRRLRRCHRDDSRGRGSHGLLRRRRHGLRVRRCTAVRAEERRARRAARDSDQDHDERRQSRSRLRLRRHSASRRRSRAPRVHHQPHDRRAPARAAGLRSAVAGTAADDPAADGGYTIRWRSTSTSCAKASRTIAAAFAPEPVIVRLSDFKSNEYANLIGGRQYEPHEENPMLGFRGASRYVDESFRPCFELECRALKRVREEMGLTNVQVMVPFVRTRERGGAGHSAARRERPRSEARTGSKSS